MRTLCTVSPNDGEAFCSRSRRTVASVLATLLLSGALHAQQAAPAAPAASGDARAWTTADDHRQMMQQLGITALRPGPSGNEQAPNAANYDEAKANPYPNLPPLLTLKNGQRVANARQWARRRAEIVEDFEREVIGRVPPTVPRVTWSVTATDTGTIGGRRVIGTQLVGHVDNSAHPAIAVDIPAMTLGDGSPELPINESVRLKLTGAAHQHSTLGTSIGVSLFPVVPTS